MSDCGDEGGGGCEQMATHTERWRTRKWLVTGMRGDEMGLDQILEMRIGR